MNSHLITYAKGLVGQYFQTTGNNKLVVYLSGAPTVPSDKSQEALLISKGGFDLISPDYYGYGRSDGFFSPKNCIQTVFDTIQTFRQQVPVLSLYLPHELLLPSYDEIIIVGASYGGRVAAAMPRFDETIKEIVLLYPSLDRLDRNEHGNLESTDEDFLREYLLGYKNIYRIDPATDPYDAFLEFEGLFSLSELGHLSDTKVFVGHGSADEVIRSGRSRQFVDKLRQENPQGDYHYAEYYGLGHGGLCKQASIQGWLFRRKQFKK